MDDAWLHTFTPTPTASQERSDHKRRATLLAEHRTDVATEAIAEANDGDDASPAPPRATLSRRAQSYSDFYDVVTASAKKEQARDRQSSIGTQARTLPRHDDVLDFEAEFCSLEERFIDECNALYDTYRGQVELYETHLQNGLASTEDALALLATLSTSFKLVEAQSDAFRQQCESFISEERRLSRLAEDLEENSSYYAFLEPMTRRLNAPGAANLVKGTDFPAMLSNLDKCLAYMESHPSHKESATYRSRYRLLLTRALTLIRHQFTKTLGDISTDISKRLQGEQLKETTHSALLYAKFRVPAPELKVLGLEIQKRAVPTPDDVDAGREPEYAGLMRELYQSYSAARGRLMLPLVSKKMAELGSTPQQMDVVAFANASIGFMRGICLDEHDLWFEWFETDGALYDYMESLMEPAYDYLRPKVIHETKLEKLCELCSAIQGRFTEIDSEAEDEVSDGSISPSSPAPSSPVVNGKRIHRHLDFPSLVQPALEDAQTRLVFLALTVLRDGIENYRPKSEELDWPKLPASITPNAARKAPALSGKRSSVPATPATPIVDNDIDDTESVFSKRFDPSEARGKSRQWYATLRKALWLLRRIYRLVNSTVFDDLAHRIVHSTIQSLLSASQQISSKKSPEDGRLFLITHLLHLKQQIVAFDIEFVPPEVEFDFSSVTNTFYEFRDRGALWNPASWMRLVGGAVGGGLLPKVVENMLDAKAELDGRLRTVINAFVNGYANHITAPVEPSTVSQAKAKQQFDALKAVRTVRGFAEKDVPLLRAKLVEYVDDARTRETLVAAVRDQVMMSYEDFFDTYSEGQGKKLSRKGKAREDEVLSPDLFGEAMERVFQVGQVVGDENNDSGSGGISD